MENENKQRFIQFPETYDRRRLNKMYRAAGLPDRKSYLLRNYFCAMANLYGTISLAEAWKLIHAYHPRGAITEEQFWTFAELARHEDEGYDIMGLDECFADEPPHTPQERSIISGILFDTDEGYADMLNRQRGKPLYVPATQEEMLYYADWRYVEATPWQKKLVAFLMKRMPKNWYLGERERALWEVFFDVRVDGDVHLLLGAAEEWGLVMKRDSEVEEFAALCVDYTNHARLFSNRGHTPAELSTLMPRDFTQRQTASIGPRMREALASGTMTVEELREQFRTQEFPHESVRTAFLEELERVAAELGLAAGKEKVGRNDPCPCGSGKKYKKCCGR